ncbi:MAG: serine hydrolase, partial [Chloroflexota bacterium]|nr:serine hydrolase [Chloroflexota bacterium]
FLKENQARGYFSGEPLEHFYNSHVGAGSVLSNASDMAKYIKMVLGHGQCEGNRVLRPETLDEMLTPQDLGIGLDSVKWSRQGLGWGLSDPELEYAGRVCGHDGATVGFCSHLEILVDQQLGVVILTNSDQKNALGVIVEIGRETLKLAIKDKAGIDPVELSEAYHSPHATWPQEKLEALAGVYVTEGGYDTIKATATGLEWTMDGGTPQKLVPLENGRFALPDSQEFQIEFTTISGRDVMVLHSAYTGLRGDRYDPGPTPAVWSNRLGKYEITKLYPDDCFRFLPEELRLVPDSIDLADRDRMLVIRYPVQGTVIWLVIEPLSDTVALIRGLGSDKGGALQIVMVDGEEQIQLWGSLYKK